MKEKASGAAKRQNGAATANTSLLRSETKEVIIVLGGGMRSDGTLSIPVRLIWMRQQNCLGTTGASRSYLRQDGTRRQSQSP